MPRKKKYKITAYGHQHMPFVALGTIVELSWTPNLLYWEEV
jgi:hypothetical protein